jgi:hypothetical protein
LTGSIGAGVSVALAGAALVALGLLRHVTARRTRLVFAALVSIYVAVIAGGAGYGLRKGTLPHTSLAFRWQYWQAAGRAYTDAPLTGIGRENFRSAYLLYKPAESSEEVGNPHNLWLSLLVELGPLGLLAGLVLIGGAAYGALLSVGRAGRAPPGSCGPVMCGAVPLAVLLAQATFSGEPFGAPGILLLWSVYVAGLWLLGFVVAWRLITQVDRHPQATGWLVAGLFAALCAALVHNLIGLSLLTPAGLAVFITLAAAAIALRAGNQQPGPGAAREIPRTQRGLAWGAGLLLAAGYIGLIGWPTFATAGAHDRIVRRLGMVASADGAYADLAAARQWVLRDPWDAELPLTLARLALEVGRDAEITVQQRDAFLELADSYVRTARERSPATFAIESAAATIATARADASGHAADLRAAATRWQATVGCYPTNPQTRIAAAEAAYRAWRASQRVEYARQAFDDYQAALAIDTTRAPDVAAKLRPFEVESVRRKLDELRAAGLGPAVTPPQ